MCVCVCVCVCMCVCACACVCVCSCGILVGIWTCMCYTASTESPRLLVGSVSVYLVMGWGITS